jgi:hypothetical protein
MVLAGLFMCAGIFGTYTPAKADTFSHLPTIDLYPTVNFATGNDEYGSPGGPDPCNNYILPAGTCPNATSAAQITSGSAGNAAGGTRPGKLDLNAVISIPLLKSLAFQYEHDRAAGIDTTIGRVTNAAGQYVYPGTSNDISDTFRLVYTGIKGVGVTLATFYRFRHDNTATNDPLNLAPADWHQQTLTVNYTLPAIAALNGTTIGISATGVYNKHHVSGNPNLPILNPGGLPLLPGQPNYGSGLSQEANAGFSDTDGKARYGINYGPNINIPINHGFALFGSAAYGGFDYFDNSPVPFYYSIIDFGIVKKFNNVLSLTSDLNNLVQQNRGGWPFVYPNTIHRIYFAIALDIHLAPSGSGSY